MVLRKPYGPACLVCLALVPLWSALTGPGSDRSTAALAQDLPAQEAGPEEVTEPPAPPADEAPPRPVPNASDHQPAAPPPQAEEAPAPVLHPADEEPVPAAPGHERTTEEPIPAPPGEEPPPSEPMPVPPGTQPDAPEDQPEGGGDVPLPVGPQPVAESERRLSVTEVEDVRKDVQNQVQVTPGLEGVVVLDAYEAVGPADSDAIHIAVTGKLRTEEQRALLHPVFSRVLKSSAYWRDLGEAINIDLTSMQVVGRSSLLGARYYGLALEYFWHCDYVRSERAITLAVAEAPDEIVYRYWSVLVAIAAEDFETARLRLRPLLAVDPYGSSSPDVAPALERVQGPLRLTLQKLEKELLLEGDIIPESVPGPPQPAEPDEEPAASPEAQTKAAFDNCYGRKEVGREG